ncbi:MAG: pilus assembly protein, partial [Myxococcales bacterium]|nr:pilus assembly protein [Myxococcales bacterium]
MKILRKKSKRQRRGAAMTEAAIMLPSFVLVLAGIIYFGEGFSFRLSVQIAARYSAWQMARGDGIPSNADIQTRFFRRSPVEQLKVSPGDGDDRREDFISQLTNSEIFTRALQSSGLSFEIHTANVEYSWTDNFLFNNRDSRSAAKVVLLNNQVGETEPDV